MGHLLNDWQGVGYIPDRLSLRSLVRPTAHGQCQVALSCDEGTWCHFENLEEVTEVKIRGEGLHLHLVPIKTSFFNTFSWDSHDRVFVSVQALAIGSWDFPPCHCQLTISHRLQLNRFSRRSWALCRDLVAFWEEGQRFNTQSCYCVPCVWFLTWTDTQSLT